MAAGALAAVLLAAAARPGWSYDVRVAKGFYTRPYDTVRLSIIGGSPAPGLPFEEAPSLGPAAHRAPFAHRWTTKTLQSELIGVAGTGSTVELSNGDQIHLKLAARGSGVTGLFFSDPCFTSRGGFKCPNGERFQVLDRLTSILNRLLESDEFDFWGMLGDHFYDILGGVSSEFFARLTVKAKSKPFLAVVGNHDFWLGGQPPGGPGDQLGYGFMQFYGQDTAAGLGPAPYNLAGNPDALEIPRPENFITGTQIGDLAFFSFSSAHDWSTVLPHVVPFCAWAGREPTVHAVIVLGHWDVCDLGCKPGMDTPSVAARMRTLNGCNAKRLLLFAGHQHCNRAVNSSGPLDAHAFIVGGAGMYGPGCSQFGFTVVQSHPGAARGPDVRVDHFPVAAAPFPELPSLPQGMVMRPAYWDAPDSYDRYEALSSCLDRSGYAGCRSDHGQSFRALSREDIVTPRPLDRLKNTAGPPVASAMPSTAARTTPRTAARTSTTTPTPTVPPTTTSATRTATSISGTTTTTTVTTATTATATITTTATTETTTTRATTSTAATTRTTSATTTIAVPTVPWWERLPDVAESTRAATSVSTSTPASTTAATPSTTSTSAATTSRTVTSAATPSTTRTSAATTSRTATSATTTATAIDISWSPSSTPAHGWPWPASEGNGGVFDGGWREPLEALATTSALSRRATATTTGAAATAAAGPARRPAAPATAATPAPGTEPPYKEHLCWVGLHDPQAVWTLEKAAWCCRELRLGCHKRVSTAPPSPAPPTSSPRGPAAPSPRSTMRPPGAPMDQALEAKDRARGPVRPDHGAQRIFQK